MLKLYKELYFRLFCLWLKKADESENAKLNAVITITLSLYFNLMSLILLISWFLKNDVKPYLQFLLSNKLYLLGGIFFLGVINYCLLAMKSVHTDIINNHKDESDEKRRKGNILAWGYLCGTLIFSFTVWAYLIGSKS